MPRLNPLRKLYVSLNSKLDAKEVKTLKYLLVPDHLQKNEVEQLHNAMDIFSKLEEKGHISLDNLELVRELFPEIQRSPLVEEVDKFLRENRRSRPESQLADTTSSIQISADTHHSGHGDVTASSERSTAAVHREMTRAMQDPDGETTSVQHHIDNHSVHCANYQHITQKDHHLQEQAVQGQVTDSTGIILECEERLKSYYGNLSHILPFPWWDGTNRLKLENVYTELELQTKEGNKRDFARREMFDSDSHSNPKRVLIEGDPGYGKSTFCKKLAYDWAEGIVEYLNCFKLLFFCELKDLSECDGRNTQDAIFKQLPWDFSGEGKRQELWNYIQDNQMKVCFVFDGLDEVPTKNLPEYFKEMVQLKKRLLPDCKVIVTSRKIRDSNSKQMYDTQLSIKGFDDDKAKAFVEKHINAMNSTGQLHIEAKASDFLKELEMSSHKYVLFDFMQSPLNTLMLCDIWIYAHRLPHTITELYEEIVHYVVKRYRKSHDCDSHFDKEIEEALFFIGKMSYRGLTTDEHKVYFSEEDISKNRYIRELGLLTKISVIPSRYGFYHLTFQEYFASVYVVELFTKERYKFVDAIYLLSKDYYFRYNDTLLAFIGGKLKGNVGEIFQIWEEKGFSPDIFFDPRPILYESCCKSTDVFKHCAQFLPEELQVDFNTMVHGSDSNELNVNATILQCADTRSKRVSFIVPASNADTVAMYQKCFEALQKNTKVYKYVSVEITCELFENNTGGKTCIEDFTFISNTQCDSRPNLKEVTVDNIILEMPKFIKSSLVSIDHYITNFVKGFSRVSADNFHISEIPFSNLKFMKDLFSCLSGNKQLNAINVTFCKDSLEIWHNVHIKITAKAGKFNICCLMNTMHFELVDLHNLLSTFASVGNKRVSLDVEISYDMEKLKPNITNTLKRLESVDIRQLSLNITGDHGRNTDDTWLHASSIVKKLSNVSANKLQIKSLPLRDREFIRDVLSCLRMNRLLKAVDVTFCEDFLHLWRQREMSITASVGKFTTYYKLNNMDFKLVDLHDLLSTFVPFDNESVSLDVRVESDFTDEMKGGKTDMLQRLELVDMGKLSLNITGGHGVNTEDICLHSSNIVKALSKVSTKQLVIERLPLGNLEFMQNVLSCLNTSKLLQAVDLTFYEDYLDQWQKREMNVTADVGKFTKYYKMNNMDFKLVDLHSLLSTFTSVDNERLSLDFEISPFRPKRLNIGVAPVNYQKVRPERVKSNVKETLISNIPDTLHKFKSVDLGLLSLNMVSGHGLNTEDIRLHASTIVKALSRVSADRLEIERLPLGNTVSMRDVLSCRSINRLLKAVDVKFYNDCLPQRQQSKMNITANVGKFTTYYEMNNIDFRLVDLHRLLSKFASVDNEKVSLEAEIKCDMKEELKSNITDTLHKFKSVDIGLLSINIACTSCSNNNQMALYLSTIIKALLQVSVDKVEFVLEQIPSVNLELVREVVGGLGSNKLLKSIHSIFSTDCVDPWKTCKVKLWANFGKFQTCYFMNTTDFMNLDLVDLQSVLSTFATDNEKVSLDVELKYDVKEKLKPNITETLYKLESVDIELLSLIISGFSRSNKEEISLYISNIMKELSQVSADTVGFVMEQIPILNLELVKEVVDRLNSCTLLMYVHMIFCGNSVDSLEAYKVKIRAHTGKIETSYLMNSMDFMDFEFVDLHSLLSTFASVDNERVTIDVEIKCDVKEKLKSNITNTLQKLTSVDIRLLSLNITGFSHFNKQEMSLYMSTIIKALSQVSAEKVVFETKQIPILKLELVKEVADGLNSCTLLKSVDMIFCEDSVDSLEAYKVKIWAHFGKIETSYLMNSMDFMDFELVDLHSLLSTFASVDDERVTIDVEIQSDVEEKLKSHITDALQKLKSVNIRLLSLNVTNKKEISLYISTIIKALSQVSADKVEFVIEQIPSVNLELVREVVGGLARNKQLKSVHTIFSKDRVDFWKTCKVKLWANFGKFQTNYFMNTIDFMNLELVDLQSVFSTFATDNEKVSLDVELKYDVKEKLKPNITETLYKLESVDIELLSLIISGFSRSNKEETSLYISNIMKALSQISADTVEFVTEQIPILNLELVKEVADGLNSCTLLKSVHMIFWGDSVDSLEACKVKLWAHFGQFQTCYLLNTTDFMEFELVDLHSLLSRFASENERVSIDVEINFDIKRNTDSFITKLLQGLKPADMRYRILTISGVGGLKKEELSLQAYTNMQALSQLSANKIYIEGLPLGNLDLMVNVIGCLNNNNLLKSVDIEFCEGCLKPEETGKLEISVKFGKFQLFFRMNKMNFSLLGLKKSLLQSVLIDDCGIKMIMKVNYDLKQSKGIDLRDVYVQCLSVRIEEMTLQILNGADVSTENIYSRTSDVMQSFSMVDAKEFVISGLPVRNIEFIKAVHTNLVKSVPNKLTHIYFEPLCFQTCEIQPSEHTNLIAKSSKHTLQFRICKSKFDILSLYQELHKTLSTDKETFTLDARIKCTSNIKLDSQYILSGSESLTFIKLQYVEESNALYPATEVLESLAALNAKHFSYKSKESLGYNLSKSVVDTMLQFQSAETVVLQSARQCDDVEIAENIKKYVEDRMIIHGVKFEGDKVTIQGMCTNEGKTLSKLIEVEFALNHESNINMGYDDVELSRAILDDSNALTKVYMKICYALKTICGLKSLCIKFSDILSTEFHTRHPRVFLIESVHSCILALPCLTKDCKVTIVGGKIHSTDDSPKMLVQVFTKESLEKLEFKDCDLNDSCESVIIESVIKADEHRRSQLKITLCDSLSSQNVDLMKEKLSADGFVLSDTGGSHSQEDVVFALKGKYVSIVATSCKGTNGVH